MKFWLLGLTLLLVVASDRPAFAAKINLSYTTVLDRIRPEPQKGIRLNAKFEINLAAGGAVSETIERKAGRSGDNFKRGMKLGDGWQVVSENTLRRVINQPQSQVVITVTTNGPSCSVDVKWTLKPGFDEYKFRRTTDGTMAFFTQPQLQSSECSIK